MREKSHQGHIVKAQCFEKVVGGKVKRLEASVSHDQLQGVPYILKVNDHLKHLTQQGRVGQKKMPLCAACDSFEKIAPGGKNDLRFLKKNKRIRNSPW